MWANAEVKKVRQHFWNEVQEKRTASKIQDSVFCVARRAKPEVRRVRSFSEAGSPVEKG